MNIVKKRKGVNNKKREVRKVVKQKKDIIREKKKEVGDETQQYKGKKGIKMRRVGGG